MKSATTLRAASVASFLFFAGHTAGYPWTPSPTSLTEAIVGPMKSSAFPVMGTARTYWDFYLGFGLTVSVLLLLESVVLWCLATLVTHEPRQLRPVLLAFLVANLLQLGLVIGFFFVAPLALNVLLIACLLLALRGTRAVPVAAAAG